MARPERLCSDDPEHVVLFEDYLRKRVVLERSVLYLFDSEWYPYATEPAPGKRAGTDFPESYWQGNALQALASGKRARLDRFEGGRERNSLESTPAKHANRRSLIIHPQRFQALVQRNVLQRVARRKRKLPDFTHI